MGKDLRSLVIRPVVSEKSVGLMEAGKYSFEVAPEVTKIEVRQAIEKLFKVKVRKVNFIKVKGKRRRFKYTQGRTKHWKKAIASLQEGEKIELFE